MGLAVGWNITNVGAVAEPLANAYGIGLGVIGLFTTSLFLVHALVQIPGGRLADRHGAFPVAVVALVVMAAGNGLLLAAPNPGVGIAVRALVGLGTGVAFVAGSDYVRAAAAGPVAQGVFGGSAMAGGGFALAVVPALHGPLGWRASFATALAVALASLVVLALSPRPLPRRGEHSGASLRALLRDRRLDRLAVAHMASLGLNAVVANWAVTLLVRAGGYSLAVAGVASALTLTAGIAGRPLGGWLARRAPGRGRALVATSLAAGAGGTALLLPAGPLVLVLVACALVGFGAGLAFAPVFAAAAGLRPAGPGAAVGLVNMAGNLVIVAGMPLLGLSFALPGDGRLGFAAVAALWAAALLALPRARELAAGEVTEPSSAGTPLSRPT
ncbi:MAG: MFS transporter [Gaiellaceae bacterium]